MKIMTEDKVYFQLGMRYQLGVLQYYFYDQYHELFDYESKLLILGCG